ncbi:hypothetical protein [Cyanobium sp. LEGE 06113]|uniref:hypothetical protein n=1 Tax=Cyanobium sp. LEGE 06113 TaxID=1297573 RepID=UPI0018820C6A|nr:hypothetical protein [Cyanobium sp. LEGE 06113]MBE9154007.1 hypothetical protein [Cyanobium sp. LEGE 06113]
MRSSLFAAACLLALATTACQQQDMAARKEKTEAKICAQLTEVSQALSTVAQLTPASTVGEAKEAEGALGTAITNLEASEQKLEELRTKAFQEQLKTFRSEVAQVASSKDTTLEEAAAQLKAKAQPVMAARAELSRAVECEEPGQP